MKFSREGICYAGAAVLQLAVRGHSIGLDSTPDQRPAALRRDLGVPVIWRVRSACLRALSFDSCAGPTEKVSLRGVLDDQDLVARYRQAYKEHL
jgi:hypothetical protein